MADNKVVIDINAIEGIEFLGQKFSASEVLLHYKATGNLLYDSSKGNSPIKIEGDVKIIDTKQKTE